MLNFFFFFAYRSPRNCPASGHLVCGRTVLKHRKKKRCDLVLPKFSRVKKWTSFFRDTKLMFTYACTSTTWFYSFRRFFFFLVTLSLPFLQQPHHFQGRTYEYFLSGLKCTALEIVGERARRRDTATMAGSLAQAPSKKETTDGETCVCNRSSWKIVVALPPSPPSLRRRFPHGLKRTNVSVKGYS